MSDSEPEDFEGAGIERYANDLAGLHGVVKGTVHGDFGGLSLRAPGGKPEVPGGAAPAGNTLVQHFGLKNPGQGTIQQGVRHGCDSTAIGNGDKQSCQIRPALLARLGVGGGDECGHPEGRLLDA